MIIYTTAQTDDELKEILDLQQINLQQNLSTEEVKAQGFVTVTHTFDEIQKLNKFEQQLIIKDDGVLIGYLLAMTKIQEKIFLS